MKVFRREIPPGDTAVDRTVAEMVRLARRDARDPWIMAIARQLQGSQTEQSNRNAFNFVCQTIPYVQDPSRIIRADGKKIVLRSDSELLIAPKFTLTRRIIGGDCDDLSMALVSLILAMGGKCWYKTIAWRCPEFTHVYVVGTAPGMGIYPMDPVNGKAGYNWEKGGIIRYKLYQV